MKYDVLIKNGTIISEEGNFIPDCTIAIIDDYIAALVTDQKAIQQMEGSTIIDGRNKVWIPGLIDSHMHTGQQLLRGRVLDEKPIIWTRIMLPFESKLTPAVMRLSAEIAALEMIKNGTTAFVESGSYFMNEAARVYWQSGLRCALSYSTMDEPGLPASISMTADEAINHTDRLYDNWHEVGNLQVYYSLRALNSCSDTLIEMAIDRAQQRNTVLQAHMNEYQGEIDGIVKRTGVRPYEYLERKGALKGKFLGVHNIMLSEAELEIIKAYDVALCHCPFSNCGKGVPNTPRLLSLGLLPGLGSDGAAHGGLSLWQEMKIFRAIMNVYYGVPQKNARIMPADTIFSMVWQGGAQAINTPECGNIAVGCKADLISLGLCSPHILPTGNLMNTLLECAESGDVQDMLVGGRILMRQREIQTLDEERILYNAKQYMKMLGVISWI